jgi:hypothetical protein
MTPAMSDPQHDDLAAGSLAAAVRFVERRLRWVLVVVAAFIVLVLAAGGFSLASIVVACIAAIFLAAAWLGIRAFAAIGRSP